MDECEQSETNLLDENSADENDVDAETMSCKLFFLLLLQSAYFH